MCTRSRARPVDTCFRFPASVHLPGGRAHGWTGRRGIRFTVNQNVSPLRYGIARMNVRTRAKKKKKKGPSETLGTSSHRLDTYAIRRSQHLRGEHIMARARGCARRSFAKGASMWSSLRNLHYTGRRATVRAWSGAYNNSKRTPVALRRKKST